MRNTANARIAKFIASALAILGIVGEYRSLVDNRPFPQSFDEVIRTAIAACWQVLTSPIVLTALVIFAILYLGRQQIALYLPAVKEFRTGMFAARFDPARLEAAAAHTVSISTFAAIAEPSTESAKISEVLPTVTAEVRGVISRMQPAVCRFLLKVADKSMSVDDLIRSLETEPGHILIDPKLPAPYGELVRYLQASGYFHGLINLMGVVFTMHIELPHNEPLPFLKIVLDSSVEQLLKQRMAASATSVQTS
jgi:hypothetical protein